MLSAGSGTGGGGGGGGGGGASACACKAGGGGGGGAAFFDGRSWADACILNASNNPARDNIFDMMMVYTKMQESFHSITVHHVIWLIFYRRKKSSMLCCCRALPMSISSPLSLPDCSMTRRLTLSNTSDLSGNINPKPLLKLKNAHSPWLP